MGGGLMQLVAYGAQDVYLSGNPQITFFKLTYRRHTNFSMEAIEQTFNGTADFGRRVTCQIARNGDLIHRLYLQVTLENASWLKGAYVGLALIKSVELEIGGQSIDKHYGDWMYIWSELSLPKGRRAGFDAIVGGDERIITIEDDADALTSGMAGHADSAVGKINNAIETMRVADKQSMLFVPLDFWFCRNPGLALPLVALPYHEVTVNVEFNTLADTGIRPLTFLVKNTIDAQEYLFVSDKAIVPTMGATSLWVDYIFLDTDERRRFAQHAHEYLIEQLQFTGEETIKPSASNRIKLNFNHPIKELVWVMQQPNAPFGCFDTTGNVGTGVVVPTAFGNVGVGTSSDYYTKSYARAGTNLTTDAKLQLNGHDRFTVCDGTYFNLVQPFQHHTNVPSNKGISVYSFALKPEEHQPSGALNFSAIDFAVLHISAAADTDKVRVYAVNYNVLRIMGGIGGLQFAN